MSVELFDKSLEKLLQESEAEWHAKRVAFAEQHKTAVAKVTVCGKTPMKAELLAEPVARAVMGDGLAGLLRYARRERLRVEIRRVDDRPDLVRCTVHWRCCYNRVLR